MSVTKKNTSDLPSGCAKVDQKIRVYSSIFIICYGFLPQGFESSRFSAYTCLVGCISKESVYFQVILAGSNSRITINQSGINNDNTDAAADTGYEVDGESGEQLITYFTFFVSLNQ